MCPSWSFGIARRMTISRQPMRAPGKGSRLSPQPDSDGNVRLPLAQDDAHGVEQVYRYPDPAGGSHALATQAEHSPQLKGDQRGRHDFPGMVHTLNRQAKAPGQSAHAFSRKKPEVLRRGHEPPSRAREP